MPWPIPPNPPATTPEQTQYGNVPGILYGYQSVPWDSPLSFGQHALIEYNGYTFNDRYQADRVHITQITGLDDAEVFDAREPVPGGHGETPYDSWYRGRPIVLTGQIEAGSLGTLTMLGRDLKAAFAPLVESPMKLRWFDVFDSFDSPDALLAYSFVTGSSGNLAISQSALLPYIGTFTVLRSADARLWGDNQQTIRIVAGAQDASSVYLISKFMDIGNYVQCAYNAGFGSPTLTITSYASDIPYVLATLPVAPIPVGKSIWLRAKIEGDLVTAEMWLSPPRENSLPDYSVETWLEGSDSDKLGNMVLSQLGFGAQIATANYALDSYQISALYPGDIIFNAKKLSAMQMSSVAQQQHDRFIQPFQITMRASNFVALGATQQRSQTLVPSIASSPTLGFTFPLVFDLRFRKFTVTLALLTDNILSVDNRGSAPTMPLIIAYGAFNGLSLQNLSTGQIMRWNGLLADGDYLVFDCFRHTLVNSSGTNQIEAFDSSTEWLQLEPGWNDIYIGGAGYSGNTKVFMFFRGAWM